MGREGRDRGAEGDVNCPKCGAAMTFWEGEDEGSGDVLIPYAHYWCAACDVTIHDYDDEFPWDEYEKEKAK